jgi:putative FmdB family regulatory protein
VRSCGFAKDVLQKMSDTPLTVCPSCGEAEAFAKQMTAAGFQLKGSGWYVTDFRDGGNSGGKDATAGVERRRRRGHGATEGGKDRGGRRQPPARVAAGDNVRATPSASGGGSTDLC